MFGQFLQRGPLCDVFGVGAAVQGASSIVSAGIQAGATESAASTEANAADYASNETAQSAANSLAFEQGVYGTAQQGEQPYEQTGTAALNQLNSQFGNGGPQYTTPFSFSGVNLTNDPAYQFDLTQGENAIQSSAAANGGLVSGASMAALDQYAQGNALNSYQTAYNNALTNYNTAYGVWSNNQNNSFNRLSTLAGIGQQGTAAVNNAGVGAGTTVANINSNTANAIGNYQTQAGNAIAAGQVGLANSISNGLNGVSNAYNSAAIMQQLNGSGYQVSGPDDFDSMQTADATNGAITNALNIGQAPIQ